jgi:L-rhamnose mutarotase
MAKVIFTITYEVHPAARLAYLSLVEEMKNYFQNVQKKNYSVYETKGKKNTFTEIFFCEREEEYETLEDAMDEHWQELLRRVQEYILDGKTQYTTYREPIE